MSTMELTLYLLAFIAYFVPFYIARYRRISGQHLVFWFNLLFGWTLIAWAILIVVALSVHSDNSSRHSYSA
ncbi:MAG: superinfection immunity protein [Cyclobacteriaceae bacterium]|nr:superinfection immunity protein [Cyclobacteriaceae bacterium]